MENDTYIVRAVARAASILTALMTPGEGLKLDELASITGLSRSTVYRILVTLENERFVEHDDLMRYHLGLRCLQLGGFAYRRLSWNYVAQDVLDRICEQTGETVCIHIRSAWEVICVAFARSRYQVQHIIFIGRPFPIYPGASGKVFLASLPEKELHPFLQEYKQEINDTSALLQELATIRKQGYAIDPLLKTEVPMDGLAVSAPIRDHNGSVIATLSVAGPSERINAETISKFIPIALDGTEQISARLGFVEGEMMRPLSFPPEIPERGQRSHLS